MSRGGMVRVAVRYMGGALQVSDALELRANP